MTTPKGGKRGGGKPGNRNTAQGPRLGRKDKAPPTKRVAAMPLPQPQPGAKIRQRATRPKTGGKDFQPGTNSHDGEVFQRGEDQLPRGNTLLMGKIIYHDARKELYDQIRRGIRQSPVFAFNFWRDITDRTQGTATRKTETITRPPATFVLTSPDGSERPALPERVAGAATPGAVSAEDAIILGLDLEPVRI